MPYGRGFFFFFKLKTSHEWLYLCHWLKWMCAVLLHCLNCGRFWFFWMKFTVALNKQVLAVQNEIGLPENPLTVTWLEGQPTRAPDIQVSLEEYRFGSQTVRQLCSIIISRIFLFSLVKAMLANMGSVVIVVKKLNVLFLCVHLVKWSC